MLDTLLPAPPADAKALAGKRLRQAGRFVHPTSVYGLLTLFTDTLFSTQLGRTGQVSSAREQGLWVKVMMPIWADDHLLSKGGQSIFR